MKLHVVHRSTFARAFRSAAVLLLLTAAGSSLRAQDSLPTAQQILARYHEAVGSTALADIQSLHATGEFAIPAAGLTGTLEVWQGRPDRTFMLASMPGYGEVRAGFDGAIGWSVDPVEGPRVLAGPEAAQAQDDAHFDSLLRSAELIESMTSLERTTLSGYDCYKVRTVWKSGRETMDCFSTETGFLVGSLRTHHSSTGPGEALVLYEDYRLIGDVHIPTRITTQVDGVEQVITLRDFELNSVPDSAFVLPPEILKIIGT